MRGPEGAGEGVGEEGVEQGRAVGVPLPGTALVHELLTGARGLGLAEKDFAAVFDVLAKLSGLPGS